MKLVGFYNFNEIEIISNGIITQDIIFNSKEIRETVKPTWQMPKKDRFVPSQMFCVL